MSDNPQRPRREFRGTGIYPSLVIAFLLTIGILIAIIANLQTVAFNYVGVSAHAPLIVILLIVIAATAVLTEVVGLSWRRRRRTQLTRREEMRELRGRSGSHVAPEPAAVGAQQPAQTVSSQQPAQTVPAQQPAQTLAPQQPPQPVGTPAEPAPPPPPVTSDSGNR